MYNEYIYEKKLKEKELAKIKQEKMEKLKKIRLKNRTKLAKKYYDKINKFIYNMIDNPVIINDYLSKHKENKDNDDYQLSSISEANINNQMYKKLEQKIIDQNSYVRDSLSNDNKKIKENILNINDDLINKKKSNNLKFHILNQPIMRFKAKNDKERILDSINLNGGKFLNNSITITKKKGDNSDKKNIKKKEKDILLPLNISETSIIEGKSIYNPNNIFFINKPTFAKKIINSKLIKNITDKYHSKTFFEGLKFSLLKQDNKGNKAKPNIFRFNNTFLTPKKERVKDSLNFYDGDIKRFHKSTQRLIDENAVGESIDQSSDSSINDNGQEDIFKKVIELNYPILSKSEAKYRRNDNNSINGYKKTLNLLKKMYQKHGLDYDYSHKNKSNNHIDLTNAYKLSENKYKIEIIINGTHYYKIGDTLYKKDDIIGLGNYVLIFLLLFISFLDFLKI